MALKRRAFLQRTGAALAGLGLSEAGLTRLADRYQQALAQPTPRKLALLVGINQYPEAVGDYAAKGALNGCLTDVALQQELLIHRFGFAAADILTLTDQTATRQAIVDTFTEHLLNQARAGDLVLFHFSGLGSLVQIQPSVETEPPAQLAPALVPADGLLPTADRPVVQDLMLETLDLMLSALPTQQVIAVLDAGYTRLGRQVQGSLRLRSRPDVPVGQLSGAELALQAQLSRLKNLSRPVASLWSKQANSAVGLLLQAGAVDQIVAEAQWSSFSAGLFTYALTQQLWAATPPLGVSFSQATASLQQTAARQQPLITGSTDAIQFASIGSGGAEGVIRTITEEGKIRLWLGGLPSVVLENSGASLFAVEARAEPVSEQVSEPDAALEPAILQLRSREGLIGKARLVPETTRSLQPGQLVREQVRVIPRSVGLTVALDNSLERIERVDATSALAAIPRISTATGEQSADVLFGKLLPVPVVAALASPVNPDIVQDAPLDLPQAQPLDRKTGYSLFSPGRSAIPNSLNGVPKAAAEAVKTAVARMTPQLKTLLALKLLRLTQNQAASDLAVQVALEQADSQQPLFQQATGRQPNLTVANWTSPQPSGDNLGGSKVLYRLSNQSDQPLHALIASLEPTGSLALLHLPQPIPPAETVLLPALTRPGQNGLVETHLIFSPAPFSQTEQTLLPDLKTDQPLVPPNSLEVAQAILQDLHQASADRLPSAEFPADAYVLDVAAWATLSFVYSLSQS